MAEVRWHLPRRTRPVVQHGINQNLKADGELAAVAGGNCKSGSVTSAGTFSFDCDPLHVDPKLFGIRVHPAQGGVVVFERSGESSLWSKPVIDRYHHAIKRRRQLLDVAARS